MTDLIFDLMDDVTSVCSRVAPNKRARGEDEAADGAESRPSHRQRLSNAFSAAPVAQPQHTGFNMDLLSQLRNKVDEFQQMEAEARRQQEREDEEEAARLLASAAAAAAARAAAAAAAAGQQAGSVLPTRPGIRDVPGPYLLSAYREQERQLAELRAALEEAQEEAARERAARLLAEEALAAEEAYRTKGEAEAAAALADTQQLLAETQELLKSSEEARVAACIMASAMVQVVAATAGPATPAGEDAGEVEAEEPFFAEEDDIEEDPEHQALVVALEEAAAQEGALATMAPAAQGMPLMQQVDALSLQFEDPVAEVEAPEAIDGDELWDDQPAVYAQFALMTDTLVEEPEEPINAATWVPAAEEVDPQGVVVEDLFDIALEVGFEFDD